MESGSQAASSAAAAMAGTIAIRELDKSGSCQPGPQSSSRILVTSAACGYSRNHETRVAVELQSGIIGPHWLLFPHTLPARMGDIEDDAVRIAVFLFVVFGGFRRRHVKENARAVL